MANRKPAKRGETQGWTDSVVRRHTAFLRSVDHQKLDGVGIAFTFTVRDCPKKSEDWKDLRMVFFKRLERMGMLRLHWLTEWQRRGVPHLHGSIWFPPSVNPFFMMEKMISHWIELASPYGAGYLGQHVQLIKDMGGWSKYLAKHADRGAKHYQRSSLNIPEGWKGKSVGRMWGHWGEWPIVEPKKIELNITEWVRYRRLVRSWRIAEARDDRTKSKNRRIVMARGMLKDNDKQTAKRRGLSEWTPYSVTSLFLHNIARRNDETEQGTTGRDCETV